MRKLTMEQRATILNALVEGNSVNATARMCGASKITVLRLLADAGTLAAQWHDLMVRDLESKRVQVDEIWSFVHTKQKNVEAKNWGKGHGDAWVWVALDADTKLAIAWTLGGRDADAGKVFMKDLASRISSRIQLTSDGHSAYLIAVPAAFGLDVDFAQLIKTYGKPSGEGPERRYSPPECNGCKQKPITGSPDPAHISTSFVERQNLTMRMSMRRFTRLTNAFSKSLDNHAHALALHYFHYNFIRKRQTLKTTPAVMAGVADHAFTMIDFVKILEEEEARSGGRLTDYLPAVPAAESK